MSPHELRTREALHRVADGLDVSEQDLNRMEDAMTQVLERTSTSRGTRRAAARDWVVAAVAVLALVLGGLALWQVNREVTPPVGRGPSPQPLVAPQLIGTWLDGPDSRWVWEITADGRIGWVETPEDYLSGEAASGRITARDGDVYAVLRYDESGEPCTMQLRAQFLRPGVLTLTSTTDACGGKVGGYLQLEHVTPREADAAAFRTQFGREDEAPVRRTDQLRGSWVDPRTGSVLVVGRPSVGDSLTYVLDDDGDGSSRPDLRGTVSVVEGTVSLSASQGDGRCVPVFRTVVTDSATLTTTSGPGACLPEGTVQTWLRLN